MNPRNYPNMPSNDGNIKSAVNGLRDAISEDVQLLFDAAPPSVAPVVAINATGDIPETARLVESNPGGDITLTLPAAGDFPVCVDLVIKNNGAHTVTVEAAAGDAIDGGTSLDLVDQWDWLVLWSDGVGWLVKAKGPGVV